MPSTSPPPFAVSSWSLHRRIGIAYPDSPAAPGTGTAEAKWGAGELPILGFPAEVKAHGFDRIELCHFHLKSRDPDDLAEIRDAIGAAGVTLQTLLIDDGDISLPAGAARDRDIAWVTAWIEAAGLMGANAVRVIAGKQAPTHETLACSVAALRELVPRARDAGVRLLTENWLALTEGPKEIYHLLDALDGDLGLLADTGNWTGPDKYDDLTTIFSRAERCHAKAGFGPGQALDRDDYGRCLAAAKAAGYQGPLTLIFADDGDEWEGIAAERQFIESVWD